MNARPEHVVDEPSEPTARMVFERLESAARAGLLTDGDAARFAAAVREYQGDEAAVHWYRHLLLTNPQDHALRFALGRLLLEWGDPSGEAHVAKALERNPALAAGMQPFAVGDAARQRDDPFDRVNGFDLPADWLFREQPEARNVPVRAIVIASVVVVIVAASAVVLLTRGGGAPTRDESGTPQPAAVDQAGGQAGGQAPAGEQLGTELLDPGVPAADGSADTAAAPSDLDKAPIVSESDLAAAQSEWIGDGRISREEVEEKFGRGVQTTETELPPNVDVCSVYRLAQAGGHHTICYDVSGTLVLAQPS